MRSAKSKQKPNLIWQGQDSHQADNDKVLWVGDVEKRKVQLQISKKEIPCKGDCELIFGVCCVNSILLVEPSQLTQRITWGAVILQTPVPTKTERKHHTLPLHSTFHACEGNVA